MTFGEKVRYARMRLSLSQEALAKELGISAPTVARWEKGNREPQARPRGYFRPYEVYGTSRLRLEEDHRQYQRPL